MKGLKRMLDTLKEVETSLLNLLNEDRWNSLLIDYEVPVVERVWTQWGQYRICLHRIHPCQKPYFHKHPWPSAMRIVEGKYEMSVGYGKGDQEPLHAAKIILTAGSTYEMVEPDGWHSVNPVAEPVMSVMVIGKPWRIGQPKGNLQLSTLSGEAKEEIINFFKGHYT